MELRALVTPDARISADRSSTVTATDRPEDHAQKHRGLPDPVALAWQRWLDANWAAAFRRELARADLAGDGGEDDLASMADFALMQAVFAVPDASVRMAVKLARSMSRPSADDFAAAWEAIKPGR